MSMRRQGAQLLAAVAAGLVWVSSGQSDGLKLKGVEVVGTGAATRVVLDVDGVVQPRTFTLSNPDRIVIDLAGAVNAVRKPVVVAVGGPIAGVRVSQWKSAPDPVTRVVADLRTKSGYQVESQDEDIVVVVSGTEVVPETNVGQTVPGAASPASSELAAFVPVPTEIVAPAAGVDSGAVESGAPTAATTTTTTVEPVAAFVPEVATVVEPSPVEVAGDSGPVVQSAPTPVTVEMAPVDETAVAVYDFKSEPPVEVAPVGEDPSPEAPPGGVELTPSGNDRRINLDVQNADIHTVLRTLADYAGKNIIASQDVEGTVTVRLYDTPWEDALNSILRSQGFGYVEERGILRVGVLQKLRTEELESAAAERKRDDLLPIETQVIKLQFATASELKSSLEEMMSPRGKLQVDSRTNALIVSDIPSSVGKVLAMATDLDSRTRQVEITSRLVDVSLDDSKNLGINWSAVNVQVPGMPVNISGGVDAGVAGAVGNLRVGTVQSWGQLDAVIDALAKKKKANVVSNPNITTVDNREARILVGAKIPLIVADQAGNAITQLTKIGIQMSVIPHINSDKTITLDLHTEVSELSSQATVQGGVIIQTSEADTRVAVENGETAIIGGLVRDVESQTYTGVPVLQELPLVGWFFRNTNKETAKRELIIFVTPHLIEPGQRLRSAPPQQPQPQPKGQG